MRDGAPDFGGQANVYHDHLFGDLLDKLQSLYRLDETRLAMEASSLGGLAAVLQSFQLDKVSCVFSSAVPFGILICDLLQGRDSENLDCLLYLQNGQTEGAHHTNRLAQAPVYAEQIHTSLQKCYPNGQFVLILMDTMNK